MLLFVCFFGFNFLFLFFLLLIINTFFSAGRISTSSQWAMQIMCVNICPAMIMNLLMNMLSYLKKRLYKAVDKSCYGDHKTSASRVEDLFTFSAETPLLFGFFVGQEK